MGSQISGFFASRIQLQTTFFAQLKFHMFWRTMAKIAHDNPDMQLNAVFSAGIQTFLKTVVAIAVRII